MTTGTRAVTGLRTNAIVLCAFVALVVVMTYPQILHLADGTRDWGDPLLNTWIMWWEVDAVASGNFAGFFDANIYFPHDRTLAYSEFMVPQTLVAAPLLLAFDNPLIAYNVVMLLSFVATAFAMYLLGKYLTGSAFSGFVAGLALAFSPFMFGHLSHIQVIGAAGIPLAFFFLHRYFDDPSWRTLLGFTGAYVGQALANTHFAVYLTYAAGAYILYRAVRDRLWHDHSFYVHMAAHATLSVALLLPFYSQYLLVNSEMGFLRSMDYAGSWYSFLAAPPINRLYGNITAPLHAAEAALFPGVMVVLLAIVGIWAGRTSGDGGRPAADGPRGSLDGGGVAAVGRVDGRAPTPQPPPGARWGYHFAGAVIALALVLVLAISITGGINAVVAGIDVRANGFRNPLLGLVFSFIARVLLRRRFPALGRDTTLLRDPQRFYACLLFVSLVLTLGPTSPYRLLYEHVPGFDAVRAVARIHILSVFCLAVFAAYGTRAVAERLARRHLAWAAGLLPLFILAEFFSAPIPMHPVAWGDEAPAVYAWLAQQEGDHAVIEYPLEVSKEFDRMLYSTVHRKKLVNGMSGHLAPVYEEMRLRMAAFPSRSTLDDIRDLGVRWVIVHRDLYGERWPQVAARLETFGSELAPLAEVGEALVFETRGTPWLSRSNFPRVRVNMEGTWASLPSAGWTVRASVNDHAAALAVDGDLMTRWISKPQRAGDQFVVDFGGEVSFGNIVMLLHNDPHCYPRGYRVEVSDDGEGWELIAEVPRVHLPITRFLDPLGQRFEITFPEVTARHLRIVQTGTDRLYVWSIHELEVQRRKGRSDANAGIAPVGASRRAGS